MVLDLGNGGVGLDFNFWPLSKPRISFRTSNITSILTFATTPLCLYCINFFIKGGLSMVKVNEFKIDGAQDQCYNH